MGGQRLQRGAAADAAGLRRRGPDGAGLHAVLLDAPDHRARAPAPRWVDGHRRADFTIDAGAAAAQVREVRPDVVFVTSPNNPTGTAVALETIAALYDATDGVRRRRRGVRRVRPAGTPSALTLLPGRPRLVVSRTMSKAFGMAGLRLGYLAADPAVVDALQLVRLPYHLSSLTQAAARTALAHTDALLATVDAVKAAARPDRRRAARRWA